MAIVTRHWVNLAQEDGSIKRVLRIADERDSKHYTDIDRDAAIARLGGRDAAIDYGIKAAVSDAGSGGKTAADKIAAGRRWLDGAPDPRAVIAEYEQTMAKQRQELAFYKAKAAGKSDEEAKAIAAAVK